jgi:putative ABC transport system substrate-binding protein
MRFHQLGRREFITLLGAAAAWPLAARAQLTERVRRVGVLVPQGEDDPEQRAWVSAFVTRLEELGWKSGENIQLDYRWAAGDTARMPALAKEIIELKPDVILAATVTAASDRLHPSCRSSRRRLGDQPRAPGWQRHWFHRL